MKKEKLFKELNICSTSDTLVQFDDDKPLVLTTDASDKGVGAVLLHRSEDGIDCPIAYASHSLKDAEKRYAPIDKEGLAIVFGVAKFHQYLYCCEFILLTDHRPLERIFGQQYKLSKCSATHLARWANSLCSYTYNIQYHPGKKNELADALSHLPLPSTAASSVEKTSFNSVDLVSSRTCL